VAKLNAQESAVSTGPEEKCPGTNQPWLSCDAIAAQAAIDQARDADEQAAVVWPQFGVGALTLLAAVAAAYFAASAAFHTKRGADVAEKSDRPWLRLDADNTIKLQFYHDGNGIRLALQSPVSVKNFGSSPAMNPQVVIKWAWEHHDVEDKISSMKSTKVGHNRVHNPPVFPNEQTRIIENFWMGEFKKFESTGRDDIIKYIEGSLLYVGIIYNYQGSDQKLITTSCFYLRHSHSVDSIEYFELHRFVMGTYAD
jgi:hypothetical protein